MECPLSLDTLLVGILYLSLICEIFTCLTQKIAQEDSKKNNNRPRNRYRTRSYRYFTASKRRTCSARPSLRQGSSRHFVQMRILTRS